MVKTLVIGTKYYFNIDVSHLELDIVNNPDEMVSMTFDGGAKIRIDGGSWVSQGSYTYILLRMTANPNQQAIFANGTWYDLVNINKLEIVGNLRSTQGLLTNNNYKYIRSIAIDNPVEFWLYNYSGKENNSNKDLYNGIDYFGVFKEETDILNPIILIESTSFITSNYAFISQFGRYYYIVDITCVRKNLYRLSLKVDVLQTYRENIMENTDGIILRSSNDEIYGTGQLVDDRIPVMDVPFVDIDEITNNGTRKNVTLISEPDYSSTYNIAVTCMNDSNTAVSTGVDDRNKPNLTDLPKVGKYAINNPTLTTYFLSPFQYTQLAQAIKNRSNLADYIVNIIFYPFNIAPIDGTRDSDNNLLTTNLRVNTTDIENTATHQTIQAYYTRSNVSSYLVIVDKAISSSVLETYHTEQGLTFLNYEPYSTYQIYIPFHGWEDIKSYEFLEDNLLIYYVTDYSTSLTHWYIYNEIQKFIVKSGTCELGYRVGIDTTNMYELNRQKQANASSTALGVIGSLVGMGISIGTGNVVGGIGSGLSLTNAIVSGINKNNMMIEHGNVSTGGDAFGFYNYNTAYVKHTYRDLISGFVLADYITENGLPVNLYDYLNNYDESDLVGFIEMANVQYVPASTESITKTEIDEIISLLKTGIYL